MYRDELYRESVGTPLQAAFGGLPETDDRFEALLRQIAQAERQPMRGQTDDGPARGQR